LFKIESKIEISYIYEDERKKLELDEYTKRLAQAKKRINTVQAITISVHVTFFF
jgi:hypothetical protein